MSARAQDTTPKTERKETSVEKVRHNDPRSHEKLGKSSPKSTENRLRSDLGRFEPIWVVQGSATDAPKTAQERSKTALDAPRRVPRSLLTPQDASQDACGPLLDRSCGARKQRPSATARRKRVRNDFPTAGCCENHSFYCGFPLGASDSCVRRVRAKIQAFRPRKSVPRAAKTPRNRARTGSSGSKVALENAM